MRFVSVTCSTVFLPFPGDEVADVSWLRPVLGSVKTRLIHLGHHGQGSDISIGGLYGIDRSKIVGVLPVGLAHGFARVMDEKPRWVLVGGRRARVLSVSLEHTTLDLDGVEGVTLGDEATLLGTDGGETITLKDLAEGLGGTPLETVMRLSERGEIRIVSPVSNQPG